MLLVFEAVINFSFHQRNKSTSLSVFSALFIHIKLVNFPCLGLNKVLSSSSPSCQLRWCQADCTGVKACPCVHTWTCVTAHVWGSKKLLKLLLQVPRWSKTMNHMVCVQLPSFLNAKWIILAYQHALHAVAWFFLTSNRNEYYHIIWILSCCCVCAAKGTFF